MTGLHRVQNDPRGLLAELMLFHRRHHQRNQIPSFLRPDPEQEPVRIDLLDLAHPNDDLDLIEVTAQSPPERLSINTHVLGKLPDRTRSLDHPEPLRNLLAHPVPASTTDPIRTHICVGPIPHKLSPRSPTRKGRFACGRVSRIRKNFRMHVILEEDTHGTHRSFAHAGAARSGRPHIPPAVRVVSGP